MTELYLIKERIGDFLADSSSLFLLLFSIFLLEVFILGVIVYWFKKHGVKRIDSPVPSRKSNVFLFRR